jgi:hypothetical protein
MGVPQNRVARKSCFYLQNKFLGEIFMSYDTQNLMLYTLACRTQ